MWQANKTGILVLLGGGILLAALYFFCRRESELFAQQAVAVGVCLLLFGVALGTWISVRREIRRHRKDSEGDI